MTRRLVAAALLLSALTACSAGSAPSRVSSASLPPRTGTSLEWSSAAAEHTPQGSAPTPTSSEATVVPTATSAVPAPTSVAPSTTVASAMPEIALVIEEPIDAGFAATQGLTGGLGHEVVYVTSGADSGPGSYREVIGSGDRIVRFDPSLDGVTIELESPVETSASNITIDGSGVYVTISGRATRFSGTNIVVAGMHFVGNDATDEDDAITFREPETTQVFGLFGNLFEHAGDGLVDVIWNQGNDVYGTVCGNTFQFHDKGMLIDSGGDENEGGRYHVTLCRNYWYDVYQRMPFSRSADVHDYNSVFERYGEPDGNGGGSKSGGDGEQVSEHLLEANMIFPRDEGEETFDGERVDRPRDEWAARHLGTDGAVKVSGNLLGTVGDVTATEFENDPDRVFTPPYEYSVHPATVELAQVIRTTAGVCIPSGRAGAVNPCAPLIVDDADGRLVVAIRPPDGAGSVAAIANVVFVVGEQQLQAERLDDSSWALDVGSVGPEPTPVWAVASSADGRSVQSDLVLVSNTA
jgi:pectate lyase